MGGGKGGMYRATDLEVEEVASLASNSLDISPPRKGDPELKAKVGGFPVSELSVGPWVEKQMLLTPTSQTLGSPRHAGFPSILLICW